MHALILPLAQAAEATHEEESSNFLVSPDVGLMIWTLLAFLLTLFILSKLAFPRIKEALDKRVALIEDSIESAERTKAESEALLAEYRERLKEARVQADDIVVRRAQERRGLREGLAGPGAPEARGAARADAQGHRGRDAPRDLRDPRRGGGPHDPGDGEGHRPGADRRRPAAPGRRGGRRARLLGAERRAAAELVAPRPTSEPREGR